MMVFLPYSVGVTATAGNPSVTHIFSYNHYWNSFHVIVDFEWKLLFYLSLYLAKNTNTFPFTICSHQSHYFLVICFMKVKDLKLDAHHFGCHLSTPPQMCWLSTSYPAADCYHQPVILLLSLSLMRCAWWSDSSNIWDSLNHGGIVKEEKLCVVQQWSRYTSTTTPLAWASWRWSIAFKMLTLIYCIF